MNTAHAFHGFSPAEIRLAKHIELYASKSWGYCLKKYSTMAEELGVCYKTIQRAVIKLTDHGFIETERGGCNAKKIYSLAKLRDAFSQCPLNVHLISPTLYIQREKDNADASAEIDTQREEKKGYFDALSAAGLSRKEIFIFISLLVVNRVSLGTLSGVIDRFMSYCKKNSVGNRGGLFRKILSDRINGDDGAIEPVVKKEPAMTYEEEIAKRTKMEAMATDMLASDGIIEPKIEQFGSKMDFYDKNRRYWDLHSNKVVMIMNGKAKSLIA